MQPILSTKTSCAKRLFYSFVAVLLTANVSFSQSPTVYNVTGGGHYCSGGSGVHIGLDNSQTGVNYKLYRGGTALVATVAGTGAPIDFGARPSAATFNVVAVDATTSATSAMAGSATITIDPLPTAYTVTGGGSYCSGGTGVHVGLSNSASGINYTLYNGTVSTGITVAGTGAAIDFGLQTAAGTAYGVWATNTTTGCVRYMTGYVAVTVNSLPLLFNITGNSSYCSGGSGSVIGLSSTVTGTNYQLYHVGAPLGSAVAGTGTIINFGLQTDTGLYTVVATNTTTGCVGDMSGSISMSMNPLPAGYTFTGGGSYCAGDSGLHVGLSGSDVGVNYRLFRDGNTVGSLVAGTGSAIDLGLQTSESVYTVRATNATTSCYSDLPGSVSIDIPSLYAGTISGASPINDSDTITLSETVSGGAWSSSDTSIVTVNATTGVVTGVSSGYANVFYTITNMCGTGTTVVTIHDLGSHRPANDNSDPLPAADEAMQTWPNPTQGNLFVKVSSGTAKEAHVVVSNVIGEIVKDVMLETNIATGITIGSVPGIYFLTATAGTNKYSTRIEVAGR